MIESGHWGLRLKLVIRFFSVLQTGTKAAASCNAKHQYGL